MSTESLLADALVRQGFGPFFGTPCGILAPFYSDLETRGAIRTVHREDNAIGVAAGVSMVGREPVVLMQNSGLGQAVNALASLVSPYQMALLLIVSMRGTHPDPTPENIHMGKLSRIILEDVGIPVRSLQADSIADDVAWAWDAVGARRSPAALLVPPDLFGWTA